MRTGPIVTGVILLILGIAVVIGGAPILGMGQTANDYCTNNAWNSCGGADAEAGAMFVSLGTAMLWGGGLLALTGIGLIVAGVVAEPKVKAPPAPAATSVPVVAPTRPCPSCSTAMAPDARYCGACGAAVAPVKPRVTP